MKKVLITLIAVLLLSSCASEKQCPKAKDSNGKDTLDLLHCSTKTKLLGFIPLN